jgi:hypothetical protein
VKAVLAMAVRELVGMFIDDGALALLALLLVAALGAAVEAGLVDGTVGGVLLLAGCLLVLAESVWRAARRGRRAPKR